MNRSLSESLSTARYIYPRDRIASVYTGGGYTGGHVSLVKEIPVAGEIFFQATADAIGRAAKPALLELAGAAAALLLLLLLLLRVRRREVRAKRIGNIAAT